VATSVDCVLAIRGGGGPKGESPLWSADEQCLYWVDIDGGALHRFDPASGRDRAQVFTEPVGCVARTDRGRFLLGMRSGIHVLDAFGEGVPRRILRLESDRPGNRSNDGRCDPFGRFWVGTMLDPPSAEVASGALYRLDQERCARVFDGLHTANGLAFTADRTRMYFSDSFRTVSTVWACDLDPQDGTVLSRRPFASLDPAKGRPDGACCDEDGCYWSCHIDGGRVVRYTPQGRVDRQIAMPVAWPTMCAFGGPNLDVLYITSLRRGGPDAEHPAQPLAGSLFACRPGVRGVAEPRYAEPPDVDTLAVPE
jgi:sugar lactone lactonase YvrE